MQKENKLNNNFFIRIYSISKYVKLKGEEYRSILFYSRLYTSASHSKCLFNPPFPVFYILIVLKVQRIVKAEIWYQKI